MRPDLALVQEVAEDSFSVYLLNCRWTLQEMSLPHIFPDESIKLEEGPIVVSRMNDGNWFVHDGRHRCVRGLLRGQKTILARNLY